MIGQLNTELWLVNVSGPYHRGLHLLQSQCDQPPLSHHLHVHLLLIQVNILLHFYENIWSVDYKNMCSALSCPRLTVHKHLMVSFIIFYLSIIVYLEPYVSFRNGLDYRQIVSCCVVKWFWNTYKNIFLALVVQIHLNPASLQSNVCSKLVRKDKKKTLPNKKVGRETWIFKTQVIGNTSHLCLQCRLPRYISWEYCCWYTIRPGHFRFRDIYSQQYMTNTNTTFPSSRDVVVKD